MKRLRDENKELWHKNFRLQSANVRLEDQIKKGLEGPANLQADLKRSQADNSRLQVANFELESANLRLEAEIMILKQELSRAEKLIRKTSAERDFAQDCLAKARRMYVAAFAREGELLTRIAQLETPSLCAEIDSDTLDWKTRSGSYD